MGDQIGAQITPQSTQSSYWINLAPPSLTSLPSWSSRINSWRAKCGIHQPYRALIFAQSACQHVKLLILHFNDRSLPLKGWRWKVYKREEGNTFVPVAATLKWKPHTLTFSPSARLHSRCAGKLKAVCFNNSFRCDVSLLWALIAPGKHLPSTSWWFHKQISQIVKTQTAFQCMWLMEIFTKLLLSLD